MYNVKVIEYPTGIQVRVFDKAIKEENWNCDEWGEIPEKPIKAEKEDKEVDKERSALVSANRSLNMVYKYARANIWEWFFTLTFNPEKVDSFNYEEVTEKLSKWLNNMRRTCPDMKYLVVPEKHESGRYHFHGLFANVDGLKFVDSGHRAPHRANETQTLRAQVEQDPEEGTPDGSCEMSTASTSGVHAASAGASVIYNVGNYSLGFSTATRVQDTSRASSYLSKYITKDLTEGTFGKKRYWASRNLDLPMEYIMRIPDGRITDLKKELVIASEWYKSVEGDFQRTDYFEGSVRSMSACISEFI